MTCRRLPPLSEDAIVDVARGREVGRGTVAAVEAHVEHCATCAARLSRERQLTEGLRALAEATAGAVPSDAIEEQLMRAFPSKPSTSRTAWLVPAAAAAMLAAIVWWRSTPSVPPHQQQPPAQIAATSMPVAPPSPAPAAGREGGDSVVVEPPQRNRRPPATPRPSASETGFVALPAAASMPPFESGVIVRMELPQAALPAYGLEIVPGRNTPVEADLLIGQDGQARAIRLVSRSTARSGAEQ